MAADHRQRPPFRAVRAEDRPGTAGHPPGAPIRRRGTVGVATARPIGWISGVPFSRAIAREPEQRQALSQSRDCDGRPVGRLPSVTRQAQAAGRGDLAVGGYQRAGSFLRGEARPGDQERPAAGVVDAFGRKVGKVAEFLAGWQPEFQAGSDHPEPEKRPVVNEHGPLSRCRAPAVTTYSLATVVWLARRQGPPPAPWTAAAVLG